MRKYRVECIQETCKKYVLRKKYRVKKTLSEIYLRNLFEKYISKIFIEICLIGIIGTSLANMTKVVFSDGKKVRENLFEERH